MWSWRALHSAITIVERGMEMMVMIQVKRIVSENLGMSAFN